MYAIVDSAERVEAVLRATPTVSTIQLRTKRPDGVDDASWAARFSEQVQRSLWELCRAAALQPDLIVCGPVWPTTTKDMPWHPQGLDNLAWWVHMSPAPVVGIGGILAPEQLRAVAATGAAAGCVVRGLGDKPADTLNHWLRAWAQGVAERGSIPVPALPHPTL